MSLYYKKTRYDPRLGHPDLRLPGYTPNSARSVKEDFAAFLAAFLKNPDYPRFSYSAFIAAWAAQTNVLRVTYEDLHESAGSVLRSVLNYLGEPIDALRIDEVVAANSFERCTERRTGKARKVGQEDPSAFERKGIVGDWRNVFNEESCRILELYEAEALRMGGYVRSEEWVDAFVVGKGS